jgi:hypothetical protein
MPYALFEDGEKLSQTFETEQDCWKHAEEAGLVDIVRGKLVLDDDYVIQPCNSDDIVVPPPAV